MVNMGPRLIKSAEQHAEALAEVVRLMAEQPIPESAAADRLELMAKLIEDYEKEKFPIDPPDALSAIRFRLDQLGLDTADLVPYLGSRSRVSEVMAGKRRLSIAMIRALHEGLGIPADVLIGSRSKTVAVGVGETDWPRFPVKEMVERGWLAGAEALRSFLGEAAQLAEQPEFRFGIAHRVPRADAYAVMAWTARVIKVASEVETRDFDAHLSAEFLREVIAHSKDARGPLAAQALLAVHGIPLVVEPALPRASLDGCSFRLLDGRRAIALTLRHDRLDNFWFTLMHELAHVVLHLRDPGAHGFVDDLEAKAGSDAEIEADRLAQDSMIPRKDWTAQLRSTRSAGAVIRFAEALGVHPAIVAGRIRYETGNFRVFADLVGPREVRKWFKK